MDKGDKGSPKRKYFQPSSLEGVKITFQSSKQSDKLVLYDIHYLETI